MYKTGDEYVGMRYIDRRDTELDARENRSYLDARSCLIDILNH